MSRGLHATWKYGWLAKTNLNFSFDGTVIIPAGGPGGERERQIDPNQIAQKYAEDIAITTLTFLIEHNQAQEGDFVKTVNIWQMADNNLR